jgi:hypothetical protein
MATDIPDDMNNVIVLNYNMQIKELTCNFVPLSEVTTSSVQELSQLPEIFSLDQNYPNPFNPITNFGFRIAESGLVSLKIYDLLGREVATVVEKELSPGKYHFPFSPARDGAGISHFPLSSGVYYYQLKAGKFIETKKLILLK